jgi:hypothetical protein
MLFYKISYIKLIQEEIICNKNFANLIKTNNTHKKKIPESEKKKQQHKID